MDGEDCEKSGGVFDLFAKIYIFVHYHIKCQYLVNKSMRNALKNLLLAVAALLAGVAAFAQVTTSSMSGRITDPSGPVPGATVVAVHQPTGAQFYAVTDASGYYRLNNIAAGGPYKVTVACMGYADAVYEGVSVALSDNLVLDTVLAEESFTLEGVVVSAEGRTSNMRSDRAGAITSLSSKEILDVPTVSRSMNDLLKLTPQAFVSGTKTYIGGGSYRDSYVTVDGAAFNNAFGIGSNLPAGGSPISLDALDQVAIAITPYDVRQSGFTGGGINATTKSGTNSFAGTAYVFFKNQNMQGEQVRDYDRLNIAKSHYLMYGASVGGPIVKDKLFFFLNVEADRSVEPGPTRMLSQRTLDANNKLVDSGTVFTDGKDGYARPSAIVMDAIQKTLRDKWGYDPGAYSGYNMAVPSLKILGRLDWNISRNHRMNLRYSMVRSKYNSAPSTSTTGFANSGFSAHSATSMYALYFQNARYYQEQNHTSVAGELNSRFLDGKLNNVFRVSYSHQYEPRSMDGGYFPFVDLVVNGDIYTTFGTEAFSYGNLRDVSTIIGTDELTLNLGRHNLLFGAQFEYDITKNGFQRMGAGAYEFDFDTEQDLYDAAVNNTLFNNPQQFVITHGNNATFAQEFPRFTFMQAAAYLQDDISISDRFKLSAGIRFELPFYPSLAFNRNARVEEATFAATQNNPSGKYNTVDLPKARLAVSPRIGFNWDIMGNRVLVLRGGTGLFVGRIPFVWIVAQSGDAGVLQTTVTRQQSKGQDIPKIGNNRNDILAQLYPDGYSAEAAGLNLTSITLMDPQLVNPSSWKSSLALDANIPGGWMASLEGVYKKDINPVNVKNIGIKAPTYLTEVPDIASRPYYNNGSHDSQISNAYLLHNVTNPSLWGYYYSLTAKVEKKTPWQGLTGSLAYTYSESKVVNDGVGDQLYSVWSSHVAKNGANAIELGYASYVMPHRVIGTINWTKDYYKFFGTSITLSYYGGPTSRANACYYGSNSILGTGAYNYDLIDVPSYQNIFGPDAWKFSAYDVKDANGNVVFHYSEEAQKQDLWAYIQQDPYLSKHTGKVVERNGMVGPWVHRFDLQIRQNFYFYTGAKHHKHTIQLGMDIENFGNFLSPYWGNTWTINAGDGYGNVNPLTLTNAQAVYTTGAKPVFQFRPNGTKKLTETYSIANSLGSTWSMIISARYIF